MAAAVAAAAVVAAGVGFAVVMVMVVALNMGIEGQFAGEEGSYRCVRIAGNTAEKLNTGGCQCYLGAAADAAADQNICI